MQASADDVGSWRDVARQPAAGWTMAKRGPASLSMAAQVAQQREHRHGNAAVGRALRARYSARGPCRVCLLLLFFFGGGGRGLGAGEAGKSTCCFA